MAARTVKPRCSRLRCQYVASQPSGLCRKHLKAECDRLFSLRVREVGACQLGEPPHAGSLQCCHGFSRRYLKVRYDLGNAWAGCAKHHKQFTEDPIRWDLWMLDRLGVTAYADLRGRALETWSRMDLEEVYTELTIGAQP